MLELFFLTRHLFLGNLIHFAQRKKNSDKRRIVVSDVIKYLSTQILCHFPFWHQTYISIGGFCQFFTNILCALFFSYISTVVLFMMTNSHSLSRGLKIQLYKYRGDSFSNMCLHHNEVEAPPFGSLGSSSHSLEINVVINSVVSDVNSMNSNIIT